jgi:hypothetical protein
LQGFGAHTQRHCRKRNRPVQRNGVGVRRPQICRHSDRLRPASEMIRVTRETPESLVRQLELADEFARQKGIAEGNQAAQNQLAFSNTAFQRQMSTLEGLSRPSLWTPISSDVPAASLARSARRSAASCPPCSRKGRSTSPDEEAKTVARAVSRGSQLVASPTPFATGDRIPWRPTPVRGRLAHSPRQTRSSSAPH